MLDHVISFTWGDVVLFVLRDIPAFLFYMLTFVYLVQKRSQEK